MMTSQTTRGKKLTSFGASSFKWGFLMGPKIEDKLINSGLGYHLDRVRPGTAAYAEGMLWRYAETIMPSISTVAHMYARILIAKIQDDVELRKLLRETKAPRPLPGDDSTAVVRPTSWESQIWVSTVLSRLAGMGKKRRRVLLGTAVLDWPTIEQTARQYVAEKMADQRYMRGFEKLPRPTWDMLLGKETAG
ncbi:hypothetical protein NQ176_g10635 [Zarea fungicola]|uniref:Uncharacterized protein n=1 Tax=Zarea fungicola TaxID=93591 RepID=A0ACC1MGM8_9HYPO|nr:hypothetical protein NQ176_g10635 [Lecanicillium fungicola]